MAVQNRVGRIAEQQGFNFESLDVDGCWAFNIALYAHVFPERPDFSGWDASDAADIAAMIRDVSHQLCSCILKMYCTSITLLQTSPIPLLPPPLLVGFSAVYRA